MAGGLDDVFGQQNASTVQKLRSQRLAQIVQIDLFEYVKQQKFSVISFDVPSFFVSLFHNWIDVAALVAVSDENEKFHDSVGVLVS